MCSIARSGIYSVSFVSQVINRQTCMIGGHTNCWNKKHTLEIAGLLHISETLLF